MRAKGLLSSRPIRRVHLPGEATGRHTQGRSSSVVLCMRLWCSLRTPGVRETALCEPVQHQRLRCAAAGRPHNWGR